MKKLSVAFLNVRSLTLHFADFKTLIGQEQYDIIGVSETWLTENIPSNSVEVEGYNFIRKDRGTRGGGVGLYLKKNFEYEILYTNAHEALEQIWVRVKSSKFTYIIGSLYRPPKGNFNDFLNVFEDSLSEFICHEIICGGDINVNLADPLNHSTAAFIDCLEAFNLNQIISSPTRITKTTNTLLDVILIPAEEKNYLHGTKDVANISDHSLVYCALNKNITYNKKKVKVRNLKYIDKELLNDFLNSAPFESLIYLPNVHEKVNYLNEILLNIFDILAPVREIQIKSKKPPWLTDTIKLMVRLKARAFNRFKKTRSQQHWYYYKQLKNQTNIAVRNEKKRYLEHCVNNNINNSRLLWKKLNELNIYNKCFNSILPESLDKPNEINKHFLQYSSNTASVDEHLLQYYKQHLITNIDQPFTFNTVTEETVKKMLLEIKSLAVGADQISLDIILLSCPRILPFLTNIVNSCILDCVFPDNWKISRVIPLPKKQDASSYNDLRPISILPVLSKVLEKIMNAQIRKYLDHYGSLPQNQSGFRPGFSCVTTLLNITDDIIKAIDMDKTTALILIDYSKAFDTIDHELLISILHFVGFSEDATKLIRSYIQNRVQFVETNNGQSSKETVTCGVPQGSILGPLLFNLYTCNLSSCLHYCKAQLYADDTQIYLSFFPNDNVQAKNIINEDLKRLVAFSEKHKLNINALKSSVMLFGKYKDQIEPDFHITVGDKVLQCSKSAKNLGLIFDTELRFKPHVNKCIQKAYATLKMLFPNRHLLSQGLKIKLTDTLVLSHFNYCDTVYGPCLDKLDIIRIEKVQKSCLRFIYGIRKYEHITHKLKDANWLTMQNRRTLHAVVLYHNIINNRIPPYLVNKIKYRTDVHTLNLRFRGLISPPAHKTSIFRRCFTYNIYKLYNQVPDEMKILKPALFKTKYKKHLLESS